VKWKLYWGGLAAALFGTALTRDVRKYGGGDRTKLWLVSKSLTDVGVSAGRCRLFPPLIIAFTVIDGVDVRTFAKFAENPEAIYWSSDGRKVGLSAPTAIGNPTKNQIKRS
jgi:hypothetical protein